MIVKQYKYAARRKVEFGPRDTSRRCYGPLTDGHDVGITPVREGVFQYFSETIEKPREHHSSIKQDT